MNARPKLFLLVLASLALATCACQPPVFFPEFVVNTSEPGFNYSDDVVMTQDGDFVVTYTEGSGEFEVFSRRFDAGTAPLGGAFPVVPDTALDPLASSIACDASGRCVIVWWDNQTQEVWGRRFAADGTPLGDIFPISANTSVNNS